MSTSNQIQDIITGFNWAGFGLDAMEDADDEYAEALAGQIVVALRLGSDVPAAGEFSVTPAQQIRLAAAGLIAEHGCEFASGLAWTADSMIRDTLRLAAAIETGAEPVPSPDTAGTAEGAAV